MPVGRPDYLWSPSIDRFERNAPNDCRAGIIIAISDFEESRLDPNKEPSPHRTARTALKNFIPGRTAMNSKAFTLLVSLFLFELLAVAGCNDGTPVGSEVATPHETSIIYGKSEPSFRLDVANVPTRIKQGETIMIWIGLERLKNHDQDVTLRFSKIPKGLRFEPASPVFRKGDREVAIRLKADADAFLGSATIKVKGRAIKGANAANEFTIAVEPK